MQVHFRGVRGKEARAELVKDVKQSLGDLLRAESEEKFEEQWKFIQAEYEDQEAWLKYLEGEYIKHKECWAWVGRSVRNNYIIYFELIIILLGSSPRH